MPQASNWLRDGALDYCRNVAGYHAPIEGHWVAVDKPRAQAIAAEYARLPAYDAQAERAYEALGLEVTGQFNFIKYQLGIHMEPWQADGQPYATSQAMQADVVDNKHLWYFTGGDAHPFLGQANDLLRAVHDVFGHATEGYSFAARGEENAWLHHSMMFSAEAQAALTSETRGQNSWVNYGPYASLPASERPFAEQKCALLPSWCWNWQAALSQEKH